MESFPEFKVLATVTNYGSYFSFISYTWPTKGNKEILLVQNISKLRTLLRLFVLSTQVTFTVFQTLLVLVSPDVPTFKKVHALYTTGAVSTIAFNVYVVYRDPNNVKNLLNNLQWITAHFYGNR